MYPMCWSVVCHNIIRVHPEFIIFTMKKRIIYDFQRMWRTKGRNGPLRLILTGQSGENRRYNDLKAFFISSIIF